MEMNIRSIFKTVTWRILATSSTLILVYAFTQDFFISTGISFLEIVAKTLLYYLHERIWNITNFGRKDPPST
jgi:uncharacterized membrane protein